jgi:kinesin family protein 11
VVHFSLLAETNVPQVEKALKAMGSLIESIGRESRTFIEAEHKSALESRTNVSTAATTEITRLRQENALLVRLLESQKVKGEQAKDELLQRVSGLLSDFTAARDRGLREAVEEIRLENGKAEKEMMIFETRHGEAVDQMVNRGMEVGKVLDRRGGEGKRMRDGALKVNRLLDVSVL